MTEITQQNSLGMRSLKDSMAKGMWENQPETKVSAYMMEKITINLMKGGFKRDNGKD